MNNSISRTVLLLAVCALFTSCYRGNATYRIDSNNQNEEMTIYLDWHSDHVDCSFSTGSVPHGGSIRFNRLHRDESPVIAYFIEPDSLFVESHSKITGIQSSGLHIATVEEVIEDGDYNREKYRKPSWMYRYADSLSYPSLLPSFR